MNNSKKIIAAILAFAPLVFVSLLFILYFYFLITILIENPHSDPDEQIIQMPIMWFLFSLAVIVSIASLIFYLVHVVNNKKLSENDRIVWVIVIISAPIITKPIYWYIKIMKEST